MASAAEDHFRSITEVERLNFLTWATLAAGKPILAFFTDTNLTHQCVFNVLAGIQEISLDVKTLLLVLTDNSHALVINNMSAAILFWLFHTGKDGAYVINFQQSPGLKSPKPRDAPGDELFVRTFDKDQKLQISYPFLLSNQWLCKALKEPGVYEYWGVREGRLLILASLDPWDALLRTTKNQLAHKEHMQAMLKSDKPEHCDLRRASTGPKITTYKTRPDGHVFMEANPLVIESLVTLFEVLHAQYFLGDEMYTF
jgi:hypothetical protein